MLGLLDTCFYHLKWVLSLTRPANSFTKDHKMHTHHQDEVKAAVYCANMPAEDQERNQDAFLAVLMMLSAVAVLGLRYVF